MSEKVNGFADSVAKWAVPLLLAIIGFIGATALGKIDAVTVQTAQMQITVASIQSTLSDFKADAEISRQDTKEKLKDATEQSNQKLDQLTSQSNAKFDNLTTWVRSLAGQIHSNSKEE